ncbi:hypothetical protein B0O99DRAFT_34253 [Bisporella sp. PMI_857]|nr:hypothetical protein B0O99DRAFT_34253 [Bisporella sp. PMI_857]
MLTALWSLFRVLVFVSALSFCLLYFHHYGVFELSEVWRHGRTLVITSQNLSSEGQIEEKVSTIGPVLSHGAGRRLCLGLSGSPVDILAIKTHENLVVFLVVNTRSPLGVHLNCDFNL